MRGQWHCVRTEIGAGIHHDVPGAAEGLQSVRLLHHESALAPYPAAHVHVQSRRDKMKVGSRGQIAAMLQPASISAPARGPTRPGNRIHLTTSAATTRLISAFLPLAASDLLHILRQDRRSIRVPRDKRRVMDASDERAAGAGRASPELLQASAEHREALLRVGIGPRGELVVLDELDAILPQRGALPSLACNKTSQHERCANCNCSPPTTPMQWCRANHCSSRPMASSVPKPTNNEGA
mmetsp:Transcript_148400/g.476577  ORF Transcript_148400/g.476577 Transcript_148400/m.476577 type:complete len:239 (+) Transcript_148400:643-1359(+)